MKKQHTAQRKAQIVLEMLKEEKSVSQIASDYGVHPTQLYKWKTQALANLASLFEDKRQAERAVQATHDRQLHELYAEIGRLNTQLTWLKKKSGLEPLER